MTDERDDGSQEPMALDAVVMGAQLIELLRAQSKRAERIGLSPSDATRILAHVDVLVQDVKRLAAQCNAQTACIATLTQPCDSCGALARIEHAAGCAHAKR